MTAVICWSMKMRIDSSRAGRAAATLSHQGLAPKGDTNQPRPGSVGWGRVFHGWVEKGLPRASYLHTLALAFFYKPPIQPPITPAFHSKTLDARWELSGSNVCVCIADSKHPSALKEGKRRGTSLGGWAGARDFGSRVPPSLQEEEVVDEACPYLLVHRALLPGYPTTTIQGGATQAQTCLDLVQGQGWVCLRLL